MDRKTYYNKQEVLYEMVKTMKGREVGFLGDFNVRCIKAHSVYYLQSNMDAFQFLGKKMNIYYAMEHYEGMPVFSYNIQVRKEEQKKFMLEYTKYRTGFDLCLDFDRKELAWKIILDDVKRFKVILDEYKIPYTLKFSNNGFHFVVDNKYLPSGFNNVSSCRFVALELKRLMNLITLDMDIYRDRQLWRVPYSIDCRTGRIALPLDDNQIENFELDLVLPENIGNIRNRGMLERSGTAENFERFKEEIIDG